MTIEAKNPLQIAWAALNALYLELPESIANDVKSKVAAAFDFIKEEESKQVGGSNQLQKASSPNQKSDIEMRELSGKAWQKLMATRLFPNGVNPSAFHIGYVEGFNEASQFHSQPLLLGKEDGDTSERNSDSSKVASQSVHRSSLDWASKEHPIGSKIKVVSINGADGWISSREHLEGKTYTKATSSYWQMDENEFALLKNFKHNNEFIFYNVTYFLLNSEQNAHASVANGLNSKEEDGNKKENPESERVGAIGLLEFIRKHEGEFKYYSNGVSAAWTDRHGNLYSDEQMVELYNIYKKSLL